MAKRYLSRPSEPRQMEIVEHNCYSCHAPMKIVMIGISGPDTFNEDELAIASSKGVLIKEKFSTKLKESYLANTCQKCGAFISKLLVHEYQGLGKMYSLP